MKLRNYTPHDIFLYSKGDCVEVSNGSYQLLELAQPVLHVICSRFVARASVVQQPAQNISCAGVEIPVVSIKYGEPEHMPNPKEGYMFIVSSLTAAAAKEAGRTTEDLLIPAGLVRDKEGRVIGCTEFSQI